MLLLRTLNVLHKFPKNCRFRPKLHSFAVESNMNYVLENLRQILSCSEQKALSVYQTFPSVRSVNDLSRIEQNFKLLLDNGVSQDLIGDNPFLLCLEIDVLQRKLVSIKQMQPRQIDDFIPLLEMSEPVLRQIAMKMIMEHGVIPENNRIYYLSKELQIAPASVSKYCSKFKLIFFAPFTDVAKKLNILLDYNVDGEQILQSLYVFQCGDKVFISRLEEFSSNGLYDIKLWFFKCTDDKFRKILVSEKKKAKEFPIDLVHKINRRNSEKLFILEELNVMLSCDDKVSTEIYYNFINNIDQIALAKANIRLLTDHGVSLEFIRSHPVVLTLSDAQINDNIQLVLQMKPNSIEDFLPLIEMDTTQLKIFTHNVAKRPKGVPHPILYFSEKLNISPTTVSKYFAQHKKLFIDFMGLKMKLDLLVSYNVQPMSILKSLVTFKLSLKTLASKLNSLKSDGIDEISSWMLVLDTTRMKTFSARRVEEKNLFVESENTVDYVAKRLNWDESAKEKAIKYYPPLANCSVMKMKAHLDYLLNETHFTAEDISSNVSVFRRNLDELKLRMDELASIGLIPEKLYFICLDSKRYLERVGKFCTKKKCPVTLNRFKSIEKRIKNQIL